MGIGIPLDGGNAGHVLLGGVLAKPQLRGIVGRQVKTVLAADGYPEQGGITGSVLVAQVLHIQTADRVNRRCRSVKNLPVRQILHRCSRNAEP